MTTRRPATLLLLVVAFSGSVWAGQSHRPSYIERDGRTFCNAWSESVTAPKIVADKQRLDSHLRESGVDKLPADPKAPSDLKALIYEAFMTEVGEIVALRQVQGPKVAAVEAELFRTRAVAPGRRGSKAIPVFFLLGVSVP